MRHRREGHSRADSATARPLRWKLLQRQWRRLLGRLRIVVKPDSPHDVLREYQENLLHILTGQGTSLLQKDTLFLGPFARLLERDLALLCQVALIPDYDDVDLPRRLLLGILKPILEVIEGLVRGNVKQDQGPTSPTVVGAGHGAVALLACCVPDVELHPLIIDVENFGAVLHPDGRRGLLSEHSLKELVEEAALSRTGIANDDDFVLAVEL
mmetsp:Transcript_62658/g.136066  ORF Transcript_62658/g.136066 Transcript_62658/m.136066 type:complete len:212 (+) Transcript_62658:32-667(+)